MEDLYSPAKSFAERTRTHRHYHEFLEIDLVISMCTSIEDIHHGDRKCSCIGAADIAEKRKSQFKCSGFGCSHTNGKHGIGAEVAFIGSAIEFDQ